MRDTLDPGYERAARRRAAGAPVARRASAAWLVGGVLVLGVLLTVAFQSTRANSAGNNQARDALNDDISRAQLAQAVLEASVNGLAGDVRSAQAAAVGGGVMASLTTLQEMNALLAVSGPGIQVTLDDPDAASGNGAILDRDVQLLVNGLWSSGAEAVAINGVRLRVTSAIRQAGGAILVDNRPVLWPMTIDAIGNPKTIHQQFISTTGYGRFATFVQLYGITFDAVAVDSVSLPAAAAVDNHYAGPLVASGTGTSGTSGTGTSGTSGTGSSGTSGTSGAATTS